MLTLLSFAEQETARDICMELKNITIIRLVDCKTFKVQVVKGTRSFRDMLRQNNK